MQSDCIQRHDLVLTASSLSQLFQKRYGHQGRPPTLGPLREKKGDPRGEKEKQDAKSSCQVDSLTELWALLLAVSGGNSPPFPYPLLQIPTLSRYFLNNPGFHGKTYPFLVEGRHHTLKKGKRVRGVCGPSLPLQGPRRTGTTGAGLGA